MQEEKKRPRGRPATGRVRNVKFSFYVTQQERELIKEKAQKAGMTVADWVVSKIK